MNTIYEDVELINDWVNAGMPAAYRDQPLALAWARVAKCGEEAGEAIEALTGMSGANIRKGVCSTLDDVLAELADVVVTGLAAIQHFTGDRGVTQVVVEKKIAAIIARAGIR